MRPHEVALSANGLAAGRVKPLNASEQAELARLALPVLFPLWGGAEGRLRRPYAADFALVQLALLAADVPVLAACAADAVQGLTQAGQPGAAGRLGDQAIGVFEAEDEAPPLRLLARTADAWQTAGFGAAADAVLAKGSATHNADDEAGLAQLSNFLFAAGQSTEAGRRPRRRTRDIQSIVRIGDATWQRASARGRAWLHCRHPGGARDLDEALRIRK